MSKTITIEGAIYFDTSEYCSSLGEYRFFALHASKPLEAWNNFVPIMRHTLSFEVPEGFDPRPEQIKTLEAQKREITAKFQAAVTEINARISRLQAITLETGSTQ